MLLGEEHVLSDVSQIPVFFRGQSVSGAEIALEECFGLYHVGE
jgi:hypothetical protein